MPLPRRQIAANAESRKFLMAMPTNLLRFLAAQHVDQMCGPEALTGAHRAREKLLRLNAAVEGLRRIEAIVAVAAGIRVFLAEVRQKRRAPAARDLAPGHQRLQSRSLHPFVLLAGFGIVHHLPQPDDILQTVGHPRLGGFAIAPRASGLLVVGLDALGQIAMRHEAHIGLVNTHTEGDGGHHDHALGSLKPLLAAPPLIGGQARMVGQRVETGLDEPLGGSLHLAPRQAVHDAGLAAALAQESRQFGPRAILHAHRIADIRPVESADEPFRAIELEPRNDLLARGLVRRGGERQARRSRKLVLEHIQPQIILAEVMPPLRYAVRFVDCDQGNIDPAQQGQRSAVFVQQPFRRQVQQVHLTALQRRLDPLLLVIRQAGIQEGRGDAMLAQGGDLVLHQRDQGRDHHAGSGAQHRRYLVAERLAPAGGHQHKRIAPAQHRADDLFLVRPKGREPEYRAQQLPRRCNIAASVHPRIMTASGMPAARRLIPGFRAKFTTNPRHFRSGLPVLHQAQKSPGQRQQEARPSQTHAPEARLWCIRQLGSQDVEGTAGRY